MVNLNELRRTANDAVDDGYFVVPIDPAVVLALLDLLAAAESRCAALDEAVMRINAEHLDDVQRLGRERDEAVLREKSTADRFNARGEVTVA